MVSGLSGLEKFHTIIHALKCFDLANCEMKVYHKKTHRIFYFRVFSGEQPIYFFWVPYNAGNTAGFLCSKEAI